MSFWRGSNSANSELAPEEVPISALPLFGTFGLYVYADGRVVGVDNASCAVTLKDAELPGRERIFDPARSRDLPAVPRLDAATDWDSAARRPLVDVFREAHREASVPALIHGLASSWPAMGKWDFDFFSATYGDIDVQVTLPGGKQETRRLAAYLAELREDGSSEAVERPYLRGWYYEHDAPRLAADLWPAGAFHEVAFQDFFKKLPKRHHPDFHWLFIGCAGAKTPLHVDPSLTDAWLTQLYGRKRFVLCAPCELPRLLRRENGLPVGKGLVNIEEVYKRGVRTFEVVLEPGDTIYVPAFWAHYVECITESISVTWNFVNEGLFPLIRTAYLAHQLGASARNTALLPKEREAGAVSAPSPPRAVEAPAGIEAAAAPPPEEAPPPAE